MILAVARGLSPLSLTGKPEVYQVDILTSFFLVLNIFLIATIVQKIINHILDLNHYSLAVFPSLYSLSSQLPPTVNFSHQSMARRL